MIGEVYLERRGEAWARSWKLLDDLMNHLNRLDNESKSNFFQRISKGRLRQVLATHMLEETFKTGGVKSNHLSMRGEPLTPEKIMHFLLRLFPENKRNKKSKPSLSSEADELFVMLLYHVVTDYYRTEGTDKPDATMGKEIKQFVDRMHKRTCLTIALSSSLRFHLSALNHFAAGIARETDEGSQEQRDQSGEEVEQKPKGSKKRKREEKKGNERGKRMRGEETGRGRKRKEEEEEEESHPDEDRKGAKAPKRTRKQKKKKSKKKRTQK